MSPTSTSSDAPAETGAPESDLRTLIRTVVHRLSGDDSVLPDEGRLPGFQGATGWLNSEPLTPDGLRGRVVLVNFWTYTCINWLRTLPYVRAWDATYRDKGLTIIGVHTPEFGFEHDRDNVVAEAARLEVTYPIAVDNDYGVWQAFANHYWPAVYLADADGRLRYHHFGEREYAMTEMAIQQLLTDAGAEGIDGGLVEVDPQGFEVEADWRTLRSPETYLGYGQAAGFVPADGLRPDEANAYPQASGLRLNQWTATGTWTIARHATVLTEAPGTIAMRFQARDVNLVVGPAVRGATIPMRVRLDGRAPGSDHGLHVDASGAGTVSAQGLYQLIRQQAPTSERLVEIEFLEPGVEAYCFTFG